MTPKAGGNVPSSTSLKTTKGFIKPDSLKVRTVNIGSSGAEYRNRALERRIGHEDYELSAIRDKVSELQAKEESEIEEDQKSVKVEENFQENSEKAKAFQQIFRAKRDYQGRSFIFKLKGQEKPSILLQNAKKEMFFCNLDKESLQKVIDLLKKQEKKEEIPIANDVEEEIFPGVEEYKPVVVTSKLKEQKLKSSKALAEAIEILIDACSHIGEVIKKVL
jgi:hypothetical protein